MKTIAAALLIATAQAGAAIQASKVCINNDAGFVLDWYMENVMTGEKSTTTDRYPIDQTECNAVTDLLKDAQDGDIVEIFVKAILGTTN